MRFAPLAFETIFVCLSSSIPDGKGTTVVAVICLSVPSLYPGVYLCLSSASGSMQASCSLFARCCFMKRWQRCSYIIMIVNRNPITAFTLSIICFYAKRFDEYAPCSSKARYSSRWRELVYACVHFDANMAASVWDAATICVLHWFWKVRVYSSLRSVSHDLNHVSGFPSAGDQGEAYL